MARVCSGYGGGMRQRVTQCVISAMEVLLMPKADGPYSVQRNQKVSSSIRL